MTQLWYALAVLVYALVVRWLMHPANRETLAALRMPPRARMIATWAASTLVFLSIGADISTLLSDAGDSNEALSFLQDWTSPPSIGHLTYLANLFLSALAMRAFLDANYSNGVEVASERACHSASIVAMLITLSLIVTVVQCVLWEQIHIVVATGLLLILGPACMRCASIASGHQVATGSTLTPSAKLARQRAFLLMLGMVLLQPTLTKAGFLVFVAAYAQRVIVGRVRLMRGARQPAEQRRTVTREHLAERVRSVYKPRVFAFYLLLSASLPALLWLPNLNPFTAESAFIAGQKIGWVQTVGMMVIIGGIMARGRNTAALCFAMGAFLATQYGPMVWRPEWFATAADSSATLVDITKSLWGDIACIVLASLWVHGLGFGLWQSNEMALVHAQRACAESQNDSFQPMFLWHLALEGVIATMWVSFCIPLVALAYLEMPPSGQPILGPFLALVLAGYGGAYLFHFRKQYRLGRAQADQARAEILRHRGPEGLAELIRRFPAAAYFGRDHSRGRWDGTLWIYATILLAYGVAILWVLVKTS